MKSRIFNFFTDGGQIFLNPDDFLYLKSQKTDYNGIISLIFYNFILGLVIGISTGDPFMIAVFTVAVVIFTFICQLIKSFLAYIFARLLGGSGKIISTFNLMSYSSILNILLCLGFALIFLDKIVLIPMILLVVLWKMVLEMIAVSEEHNIGYGKAFISTNGIYLIILVILSGLI